MSRRILTEPNNLNLYASSINTDSLVVNDVIYNLPTDDGTFGQVLTTDGAGNLTFEDNGGGGGGPTPDLQQVYDATLVPKKIILGDFEPVILKVLNDEDQAFVIQDSGNSSRIIMNGNGLILTDILDSIGDVLEIGNQFSTNVEIGNITIPTTIKGNSNLNGTVTVNTLTNTFTLPTTRGSNGNVLTSNGLGAVQWLPPSNIQGSLIFVRSASDFPPVSIGNIRVLAEATTYYVIGNVDLQGTRLQGGFSGAIIGSSAETSILRSTALGLVSPLISATGTIALRNIRIDAVDTAFNFSGSSSTAMLEWVGVTFSNIRSLGIISAVDNFIFSQGTIRECSGLVFTGNINTIGFDRCFISQTTTASQGSIISLNSACVVQRRFRIIHSAINVSLPGNSGINVDINATIPIESYILENCNFSNTAGAASTLGVSFDDNKARWIENVGVINSTNVGAFTITGNITAITPTTEPSFGTVLAGTYVPNTINQRFTLDVNRFVFGGIIPRTFMVSVSITATNPSNSSLDYTLNIVKEISIGVPSLIAGVAGFSSTESSQPMTASAQGIVSLSSGNTIYLSLSSPDASPSPIIVTSMNIIIRPIN